MSSEAGIYIMSQHEHTTLTSEIQTTTTARKDINMLASNQASPQSKVQENEIE
jgi:hypothetical protein